MIDLHYCLIAQHGLQFNLDLKRANARTMKINYVQDLGDWNFFEKLREVLPHNFLVEYVDQNKKKKKKKIIASLIDKVLRKNLILLLNGL